MPAKGKSKESVKMTMAMFQKLLDHVRDAGTITDLIRKEPTKWPTYRSIHAWITNKELRDEYEAARRDSIFMMMDKSLDLVRAPAPDLGDNKLNHAELGRRKLEIDLYKFFCAKMAGKLYQQHQTVEHEGDAVVLNVVDYSTSNKSKKEQEGKGKCSII